MKWVKRIAIAGAALLVMLAALPFVISVDDYRPRIEKEISARLKEPVTIGRLRAFALPAPHVTAEGIVIGKTGDVKVAKLVIAPDVWSLLGETKVIRYVELDGLRLTQNGLEK
ncbi:MAG: AsmA family protein, partial [bacterium]|nr:AsmA family protein [bacterium]